MKFGASVLLIWVFAVYYSCFTETLVGAAKPFASVRAYNVFDKDQADFHKYAAILAAQETQRVIRDQELKKVMNPISFWFSKMNVRKNFNDPESRLRSRNGQANAICEDYERRLVDVVESYGLEPESFNELSSFIMCNPKLKKQIILQAFYYKLAADLEHNLGESLSGGQKARKSPHVNQLKDKVGIKTSKTTDRNGVERDGDELAKFARALRDVEASRLEMRSDLLSQLGIRYFPQDMCNPSVLPAMAPSIQNACVSFPQTAHKIMQKHGLNQNEFDKVFSLYHL